METSNFLIAFVGGILIGLASMGMLLLNGKITGISGILGSAMSQKDGRAWRLLFLLGLLVGAFLFSVWKNGAIDFQSDTPRNVLFMAGLLVGFGTRLGGGCTSGHGICGLSRLSIRSIVATLLFMGWAIVIVFITRHIF